MLAVESFLRIEILSEDIRIFPEVCFYYYYIRVLYIHFRNIEYYKCIFTLHPLRIPLLKVDTIFLCFFLKYFPFSHRIHNRNSPVRTHQVPYVSCWHGPNVSRDSWRINGPDEADRSTVRCTKCSLQRSDLEELRGTVTKTLVVLHLYIGDDCTTQLY